MTGVECWGGAECTVNRVGDQYFEQLGRTGHADRLDDVDRIAALGLRRVRFPILWEQHWQPGRQYDFTWADARMQRLRELGVDPIVGLVHHGSGPPHTNLLEPTFAEGLADFAGQVARRYPWVTYFTPVNEPLTTARFSALYGHWYPHARDDVSFARAVLTQVRAIQLAMAAIREAIPHAQLVQTEDFGTVFSTPELAYQAEFENHRRWLSWDLLFGHVQPLHPLYRYLVEVARVCPAQLARINSHRCRPSIIGINYYVTSDRFLDQRVELYPSGAGGTNAHEAYADVEAVRVLATGIVGHRAVLAEVWGRYRTPVALTEVHLGCNEEDQVSWLTEAWRAAHQARTDGVDVRAVTAWSLFGAFDWDTLVTQCQGHYESGAFDIRHERPRPTKVAGAIRALAQEGVSPASDHKGWWHELERIIYAHSHQRSDATVAAA